MKKIALISIILLFGTFSAFAQSTIYLCYAYPNRLFRIPIKINNQEVFTLIAKTQKKCILYSEGKVIISFDTPTTTPDGAVLGQWSDEIQLTLSKNSVHYIKIKPKGLNYVMFEELDEKEGKKEFAKKKYKSTPNYAEQPSGNSSETGKKGKEAQRSKEAVIAPETE